MKIYYGDGDLILFNDEQLGIVYENDNILYFDKELSFGKIDDIIHGDIYYRRLTNSVRIQPVVFFLKLVSKDISIKNFLECEFNMQLGQYVGNAVIYYIYNHLNMVDIDKKIIQTNDFFKTFQLKNNSFMKDIYLNI